MRHFNNKRELVESSPCEFWDDIEYMDSMDLTWHYANQDEWKKHRQIIEDKFKSRALGVSARLGATNKVIPLPMHGNF